MQYRQAGLGKSVAGVKVLFMNRVWSVVLAIAGFGAISPALAADAPAQDVIFDLNRDLPRTDARFDCSRGRECRYLPSNFGPFHITYALADFGTGQLYRMELKLRAHQRDVRDWLVSEVGPPYKVDQQVTAWRPNHDGEIFLSSSDEGATLVLYFGVNPPPPPIACVDPEDREWFRHEGSVKIASGNKKRADEERC